MRVTPRTGTYVMNHSSLHISLSHCKEPFNSSRYILNSYKMATKHQDKVDFDAIILKVIIIFLWLKLRTRMSHSVSSYDVPKQYTPNYLFKTMLKHAGVDWLYYNHIDIAGWTPTSSRVGLPGMRLQSLSPVPPYDSKAKRFTKLTYSNSTLKWHLYFTTYIYL